MAKKIDQSKIDELMSKMKMGEMNDRLKSVMEKMPNMNEVLMNFNKITTPKKTKNVVVDGLDCVMAISVDNKVSISFVNEVDAEKYYENFVCCKSHISTIETALNRSNIYNSELISELKDIKKSNWCKFINYFKRK